MPRIDIAMASSLVHSRDVVEQADKIKITLSSWDNCMAETYCKWPVIAACIVGGLIIFSVVWCIARCLCCGLSCCCSCFSCFKCCGNCCGCCDEPNQKHKHLDEPYFPSAFGPKQGYQAPGPMMSGGDGTSGHGGWTPGAAAGGGAHPFDYGRPRFATFETGPNGMAVEPKKVNDDALPPMPSWEGSSKRKVSIEEKPVPLQNLDPATGQQVPLMSGGAISRTGTPVASPYDHQGQFPGQAAMGGAAMVAGGRPQDPYRQNSNVSRGPGGYQNDPYANRGPSPGNYPPQQAPYNPSFPADVYGGGQSQVPPNRYDHISPNPNQGYGQDSGPSPMQGGSFGVLGGANAYAQPQRILSAGGGKPYPMDRGLSDASTNQPMTNPSGPLETRGFEQRVFDGGNSGGGGYGRAESPPPMDDLYGAEPGVGYAQPQRSYTGSTAPPSYVSRAPTNQGYPGNTRY